MSDRENIERLELAGQEHFPVLAAGVSIDGKMFPGFYNLSFLEELKFSTSQVQKNPGVLGGFEGVWEIFRNSACLVTPCCASNHHRLDIRVRP